MKIHWKSQGRTREYGNLSVPIEEGLEIDKQWDGRKARPEAWIKNGRLYVMVKRYIPKEEEDAQAKICTT